MVFCIGDARNGYIQREKETNTAKGKKKHTKQNKIFAMEPFSHIFTIYVNSLSDR